MERGGLLRECDLAERGHGERKKSERKSPFLSKREEEGVC